MYIIPINKGSFSTDYQLKNSLVPKAVWAPTKLPFPIHPLADHPVFLPFWASSGLSDVPIFFHLPNPVHPLRPSPGNGIQSACQGRQSSVRVRPSGCPSGNRQSSCSPDGHSGKATSPRQCNGSRLPACGNRGSRHTGILLLRDPASQHGHQSHEPDCRQQHNRPGWVETTVPCCGTGPPGSVDFIMYPSFEKMETIPWQGKSVCFRKMFLAGTSTGMNGQQKGEGIML